MSKFALSYIIHISYNVMIIFHLVSVLVKNLVLYTTYYQCMYCEVGSSLVYTYIPLAGCSSMTMVHLLLPTYVHCGYQYMYMYCEVGI
jgi:hypothetical protein